MLDLFHHKDLNDAQWEKIKVMFEEGKKRGRPPLDPRTVFDAIL